MRKLLHSKIIHYIILILSVGFLFVLGPRIVVDHLLGQKVPTVSAAYTGSRPAPCEVALQQGKNICDDNITFCENTGLGSTIFLKHGGICDPSHGEADSRGCRFVFTPVSYQSQSCNMTPSPSQSPTEMVTTCDGRTITRDQLESELRGANYPGPWGDITVELAAFNRAACPVPTSTPRMVTTCNGRMITQDQLESELRGANYPGPWGDINVELAAFNRAACPSASPSQSPSVSPTMTPTVTPSQTPISTPVEERHKAPEQQQTQSQQQSQIVNIFTSLFQPSQQQSPSPSESPTPTPTPSNSPVPTSSSNVSVQQSQSQTQTQTEGENQNQSQSQTQTINNPQIVSNVPSSNVQELPRTGVPLFGLASLGFAPIAWRLRKSNSKREESSANNAWERRQMRK